MSTRSLVSGGAGFIGAHVARHLIDSGHEVDVLDDLSGGFTENVPSEATLISGSVTDVELIDSMFNDRRYDYVFHLAAYAAEGLSHFIRRYNYENNVLGSINLINASVSHDVRRFVFTSSIAVYGENQLPMVESLTPQPEDPYGVAKYAVELDLAAAQRMFGLDYTIFRPHNVYGEFQNIGDKYRNVIGIFMNQIMQGNQLTIFGDGSQTRAFSYIDDVAPVIASSIEIDGAANEIFNVGADQPYTVLQLASVVAAAFGTEPDIHFLPERNEVLHAYATHDKVKDTFGLSTPTTLEVGIDRMARWARQVGARASRGYDSIEVWKNFPEGWLAATETDGR